MPRSALWITHGMSDEPRIFENSRASKRRKLPIHRAGEALDSLRQAVVLATVYPHRPGLGREHQLLVTDLIQKQEGVFERI